ncbi:diacylglycerol/lipid kinase family protein [Aquibaculum arenosum]|uniref:Diacylglycerol kinase family lipid kinase n=1 Tax=Aquibaculum arenosum TaxID=3032591 RepID=A0ABT5YPJ4_9PROT|nr:diacylglycerol kinase family protein [Fodinicurvata sp. CAU 1616]MDF2096890.1 diacylglycerol kinase family lipid kinase [Fodinicurvata sp. CAU 1616]
MTSAPPDRPVPPCPTVAAQPQRLLIIHNPIAGQRRRRRYAGFLAALRRQGVEIEDQPTTRRGDAERLVASLQPSPGTIVAAAGGDGTINEVINGLMANPSARELPLAILPLGTANVLAAEIGLRCDAESVGRYICGGHARPITLGRVNGRYFVMMAGVGFDAQVVADVNLPLKRRLGKLAYVLKTLQLLGHYSFPRYDLRCDGRRIAAASAVVANGRYYGGRLLMAPAADLTQPDLEVVVLTRSGRLQVLRYGAALLFGLLPKLRDVQTLTAREIHIDGPAGEPLQADGDIVARLPAKIETVPQALRLWVPGPVSHSSDASSI